MAEDCIFCAIGAGDAPAEIVHEDEHTVAFMDINPWARGHVLVIPRRHATDLLQIDDADLAHTIVAAKRLARRMPEALGCEDVALWNSCGQAADQVILHFHIHLIPRYEGDTLPWPERERADPAVIAELASELRG
jgi:histidine triad (HIT) family protein